MTKCLELKIACSFRVGAGSVEVTVDRSTSHIVSCDGLTFGLWLDKSEIRTVGSQEGPRLELR